MLSFCSCGSSVFIFNGIYNTIIVYAYVSVCFLRLFLFAHSSNSSGPDLVLLLQWRLPTPPKHTHLLK